MDIQMWNRVVKKLETTCTCRGIMCISKIWNHTCPGDLTCTIF